MLLLAECGITDYGIEEKKVHIKKDDSTSFTLNEKRIRTKEEPQLEEKRRRLEDIKGKHSDEMILAEKDISEDKKLQEVEYITSTTHKELPLNNNQQVNQNPYIKAMGSTNITRNLN